jgi:hypothetical protein
LQAAIAWVLAGPAGTLDALTSSSQTWTAAFFAPAWSPLAAFWQIPISFVFTLDEIVVFALTLFLQAVTACATIAFWAPLALVLVPPAPVLVEVPVAAVLLVAGVEAVVLAVEAGVVVLLLFFLELPQPAKAPAPISTAMSRIEALRFIDPPIDWVEW